VTNGATSTGLGTTSMSTRQQISSSTQMSTSIATNQDEGIKNQAQNSSNNKVGIIAIAVAVPVFVIIVVILVVVAVLLFIRKKKKEKKEVIEPSIELATTSKKHQSDFMDVLAQSKISDIEIGDEIGAGQFGRVYKGIWLSTTPVALKELISDKLKDFVQEASILIPIKHPNCLRCYGIFENSGKYYIVTEYAARGSLLDLLRKNRNSYNQQQLLKMASDASKGMHYLESMKIVHRDLSARNLLVDENGIVKVADFGLSRNTDDNQYKATDSTSVPIRWTSPEATHYGKYSSKSDVWSYGVVLYEIITFGKNPYAGMSNQQVVDEVEKGYRMPIPEGCPENLYHLMLQCWNENPEERPNFLQIKKELDEMKGNYEQDLQTVEPYIQEDPGANYVLSPQSAATELTKDYTSVQRNDL